MCMRTNTFDCVCMCRYDLNIIIIIIIISFIILVIIIIITILIVIMFIPAPIVVAIMFIYVVIATSCLFIVLWLLSLWLIDDNIYIYIYPHHKNTIYICITVCPPFMSLGWTTIHACTPRFGENIYVYIIIYIVCVCRTFKKSHACTRHVQIKTCTASRPGGKLLPPCILISELLPNQRAIFYLKVTLGQAYKRSGKPREPKENDLLSWWIFHIYFSLQDGKHTLKFPILRQTTTDPHSLGRISQNPSAWCHTTSGYVSPQTWLGSGLSPVFIFFRWQLWHVPASKHQTENCVWCVCIYIYNFILSYNHTCRKPNSKQYYIILP